MHVDTEGTNLCRNGCPSTVHGYRGPFRGEIYLHHKDGHRVPVRVRVAPIGMGKVT